MQSSPWTDRTVHSFVFCNPTEMYWERPVALDGQVHLRQQVLRSQLALHF